MRRPRASSSVARGQPKLRRQEARRRRRRPRPRAPRRRAARRRRVREPELAHVEPGQVGGLDVRHAHARQPRGHEALEQVAVAAQILEQLASHGAPPR